MYDFYREYIWYCLCVRPTKFDVMVLKMKVLENDVRFEFKIFRSVLVEININLYKESRNIYTYFLLFYFFKKGLYLVCSWNYSSVFRVPTSRPHTVFNFISQVLSCCGLKSLEFNWFPSIIIISSPWFSQNFGFVWWSSLS